MDEHLLYTRDLTIGYRLGRRRLRPVATNLELALPPGELVCLLGPNGAGKSTLLRTLAGMQAPLTGAVFLQGRAIKAMPGRWLAQRLSVVLTDRVDGGMLTAYSLVTLGRQPYTGWDGRLSLEDEAVVRQALTAVGASDLAGRLVEELSDGERQKVMIARALAQEPRVMLLDEPTAFLDLPRRVEIMHILRRLARQQGRSILLSTHDLDLALRSADRLWLLTGSGEMVVGAPEDLILAGHLERAFRHEGVQFDPRLGAFRLERTPVADIDLEGQGLAATWARRALEREGYTVHEGRNGSRRRVRQIDAQNVLPAWELTVGGRSERLDSVQALVGALRRLELERRAEPADEPRPASELAPPAGFQR